MSCEKSDDEIFKTGLIKAGATLTGAVLGGAFGGPAGAAGGAAIVGKLGSDLAKPLYRIGVAVTEAVDPRAAEAARRAKRCR